MKNTLSIVFILALSITAAAQEKKPVVVASKAFTESRVLTEIIAQLIEARTDILVTRKHGLGGSLIVA